MGFVVASFYRFVHLHNYYDMRPVVLEFCKERDIKGTIILAEQGINATIAGNRSGIDEFFAFLDLDERLVGMKYHESYSDRPPFPKMKVRLKSEVVRLGVEELDCSFRGEYVEPQVWDDLISRPGMHVIDTRNDYEIRFGRFKRSINPCTTSFREFPEWAKAWAKDKDRSVGVAMYCTGGIRCEKSTAFMKSLGFENVYHLKGGVLNYLSSMQGVDNMWEGECFVFDERVAVDHNVHPSKDIRCIKCSCMVGSEDLRAVSKGNIVCGDCRSRSVAYDG
ncbi:rhodanese-related sulfurtransferase [Candidatus Anaplasma sp. TIGMIC]|uniref:oxygen-dependent tRNA uridine(34) hydroxylase TrhO n=1 Tax=Candidatus Anaplasma sp. TIGMIC TaxID=3020713 RepID=UPI00232E0465|nr:rhodanese-related sulfurtransferase [Candidatus Anaplasma sp. TIGMIC]MDB1135045.1 rhodanese-related sulfurtransferase [Candidatus Anaplasma sp. TIGMIC]